MTHCSNILLDSREKFQEVLRLIELSKTDPEDEPYRSRYLADKVLFEIESQLSEICRLLDSSDEDSSMLFNSLALAQYQRSLNKFETDEFKKVIFSKYLESFKVSPPPRNVSGLLMGKVLCGPQNVSINLLSS